MSKKTTSIQFRCGHFERLTEAEIKKQGVYIGATFTINDVRRAESGDYCLECSKQRRTVA